MAGILDSWLLVEVDSCSHTTAAQCFLHNTHHSHYSFLGSAGSVCLQNSKTHKTLAGGVEKVVIDIVGEHWYQSRILNCYSVAVKPYGLDHLVLLMVREEVHLAGSYHMADRNTGVLDSEGVQSRKNTVLLVEEEKVCHRWSIDAEVDDDRMHQLHHRME